VREGTIVGNTIQARESPNGANVRLLGVGPKDPNAAGMWAITGNLIGSQHTAIDLQACRGVVVSGNAIYNGYRYAIRAEHAEHVVIGANSIDHNSDYQGPSTDAVLLRLCRNVNVTGLLLQHTRAATAEVPASVEVRDCQNVNVVGCQVINARVRGVALHGCSVVRVADCTIRGRAGDKTYRAAVSVDKTSARVMVVNNFLGRGSDGALAAPQEVGVVVGGNVEI
jgi:polygalacturonase